MSVELILHIEDPETGHSMVVEVDETFESVADHVSPMQQPNSALEYRQTLLYRGMNGEQLLVKPSSIELAREVLPNGGE